jgi:hypothetical protein
VDGGAPVKAFRVWGVFKHDGVELIASTAYELEARAKEICDRNTAKNGDWATFDVRPEEVPGEIKVNGKVYKTNIVVRGDANEHTRF